MKKLLLALAIVSLFKLLILPHYTSACLASTVQVGVTTDVMSDDKPALGVLGMEFGPARLTAGAGYNGRGEGAFDLLGRTKDGLYFGIGLFSEKATEYTEFSTSDTTTTSPGSYPGKGHGWGRKKHARKGGKVVTNNMYSFRGDDYATYPTALMGLAGRHTYFESRLIFGTTDIISAQASFGFRW